MHLARVRDGVAELKVVAHRVDPAILVPAIRLS